MRRDVFQAIADPTRRKIIALLAAESMPVNAVAESFAMSRQAVSKHLLILEECGLVVLQKKGREQFCVAKLQKLESVSEWVAHYRKFWSGKLDALETFLATEQLQKGERFKGMEKQGAVGRLAKADRKKKSVALKTKRK